VLKTAQRVGARERRADLGAVALEAALACREPHQRALGDGVRRARLGGDERRDHLAVPRDRVAHVERRVQREVTPRLAADAEPLQARVDALRAPGRRQLDRAERADGVVRVAAVGGERDHQVAERERLPHRVADLDVERARQPFQHRAVHAAGVALAHLVPVVARELELRAHRQLDLRHRHQVVEAGLARHLLAQEPGHLVARRARREELEQRIVLPRPALLQGLEPAHESVWIRRSSCRAVAHARAFVLDEAPFAGTPARLVRDRALPAFAGLG
jgi:hypothetical protein